MSYEFTFAECGHNNEFVDGWGLIECADCGAIFIPKQSAGGWVVAGWRPATTNK